MIFKLQVLSPVNQISGQRSHSSGIADGSGAYVYGMPPGFWPGQTSHLSSGNNNLVYLLPQAVGYTPNPSVSLPMNLYGYNNAAYAWTGLPHGAMPNAAYTGYSQIEAAYDRLYV
jgi:hypothetical protein